MELFEDFVTSRMEAGYPASEKGNPCYVLPTLSSQRYIVCAIRRSLFFWPTANSNTYQTTSFGFTDLRAQHTKQT
jgi:hypothetical protein